MKWFKHDVDMHTDLKVQILLEKHGIEGYAIWNLCLEMVGKEGKKGKIDGQLRWIQLLLKVAGWTDKGKLESILNTMAEIKLICSKSFKYGNLYIPKFMKRADDYTLRKLRTNYEHNTDNVHVDKIRIDKIIEEIKKKKKIDTTNNPSLETFLYKRYGRAAKQLLLITKGDITLAIKSINWVSQWCEEKQLNWELETVVKHYTTGLACDFKKKDNKWRNI